MSTAMALVEHLKNSGTGENKLRPVRELIKKNPKATVTEGLEVLEKHVGPLAAGEPNPGQAERPISPSTLDKAREFVSSQPKEERPKQPAK